MCVSIIDHADNGHNFCVVCLFESYCGTWGGVNKVVGVQGR